jgi:hypothetical protein
MTIPVARGLSENQTKKADVAEHPEVFDHVGLLFNEPPGTGRAALYIVIRRFELCRRAKQSTPRDSVIIRRGARECKRSFGSRLAFYAAHDAWRAANSKGGTPVGAVRGAAQAAIAQLALMRERIAVITRTVQDA